MALKKPVDETTSLFLEIQIDFICFVACGCYGTNIGLLKIPVIDEDSKIQELPVNLFRKQVIPKKQSNLAKEEPTEFFTRFVVGNLQIIHEVYRQKVGIRDFSTLLARSITAMLAFQQLYYEERDVLQVFMHGFYMPTLDDCLTLASQVTEDEAAMLASAAEYFVVEAVRFLVATNWQEHAKEAIHLLADFVCRKDSPPKKALAFPLSSLAKVYADVALHLDYRDRDGLIEATAALASHILEKLADLMNRYFEDVPLDQQAEVFHTMDCYARVASLIASITLKSYVYLTESVAFAQPATHRLLQDREGEPGSLRQVRRQREESHKIRQEFLRQVQAWFAEPQEGTSAVQQVQTLPCLQALPDERRRPTVQIQPPQVDHSLPA